MYSARADGASMIVIAGDLFDTDRPSPAMLRAVQGILVGHSAPVYVLNGNHDMTSTAARHTAISPLGLIHKVQAVEKVCIAGGAVLVPYLPGPAKVWLPPILGDACGPGLS